MKEKIKKFFLRILFGKSALGGYYVTSNEKVSKNYVFDSVFPSYEAMKIALGQEDNVESPKRVV